MTISTTLWGKGTFYPCFLAISAYLLFATRHGETIGDKVVVETKAEM